MTVVGYVDQVVEYSANGFEQSYFDADWSDVSDEELEARISKARGNGTSSSGC